MKITKEDLRYMTYDDIMHCYSCKIQGQVIEHELGLVTTEDGIYITDKVDNVQEMVLFVIAIEYNFVDFAVYYNNERVEFTDYLKLLPYLEKYDLLYHNNIGWFMSYVTGIDYDPSMMQQVIESLSMTKVKSARKF